MISLTRTTADPEATAALAAGLADVLNFSDVLAIHGPLGAGKTTLTRALSHALGARQGLASSPTFVMLNQYPFAIDRLGEGQLIHVDAYRLTSAEDLDSLGWDTLFDRGTRLASGRAIAVVEWADRIRSALPREGELASVTISPVGERARRFEFQLPDAWQQRTHFELFSRNEVCRCPATGAWVSPTSPTYPFANGQARMADLYRWLSGGYAISREVTAEDMDESDSDREKG